MGSLRLVAGTRAVGCAMARAVAALGSLGQLSGHQRPYLSAGFGWCAAVAAGGSVCSCPRLPVPADRALRPRFLGGDAVTVRRHAASRGKRMYLLISYHLLISKEEFQ